MLTGFRLVEDEGKGQERTFLEVFSALSVGFGSVASSGTLGGRTYALEWKLPKTKKTPPPPWLEFFTKLIVALGSSSHFLSFEFCTIWKQEPGRSKS